MKNYEIVERIIQQYKNDSINNAKIGYHNNNYILKIDNIKYILRIPVEDFDNVDIRIFNENDILDFITKKNISINHPYFIGSGLLDNKLISVHSFVEGKTFRELGITNLKIKDTTIESFAEILAELHKIKKCPKANLPYSDVFSFYDYNYNFTCNLIKKYYSLYKERIFQKLGLPDDINTLVPYQKNKLFKNEFCLCHNDFHTGNVIINDKKLFLLDWELVQFTDPCYDIAIHFNKMRYTKGQEEIFMDKYLKYHKYNKEKFINQVNVYKDLEIVKSCVINILRLIDELKKYNKQKILKKFANYITKLALLEKFKDYKMPTKSHKELYNIMKNVKIDLKNKC